MPHRSADRSDRSVFRSSGPKRPALTGDAHHLPMIIENVISTRRVGDNALEVVIRGNGIQTAEEGDHDRVILNDLADFL